VHPPDRNNDACGQVLFNAAAAPIRPPPPLPGRHPTRVAAPLHDFDDHDHLDLDIKGMSSACGTRRFLLQSQHSRHHNAATAGGVSSSDSTFDLFSSLTVCGATTVTAGDVRVYLIGYIFCIIDCHICQDIFDRIDIMYCRLPYVSRGALTLKTRVLYIYRSRGTMQYNQQLYTIYSFYSTQSIRFWKDLEGLSGNGGVGSEIIDLTNCVNSLATNGGLPV
jgi:hypothetical protein